ICYGDPADNSLAISIITFSLRHGLNIATPRSLPEASNRPALKRSSKHRWKSKRPLDLYNPFLSGYDIHPPYKLHNNLPEITQEPASVLNTITTKPTPFVEVKGQVSTTTTKPLIWPFSSECRLSVNPSILAMNAVVP
ncbi:hypothetical protein ILUMI_05192, partial [Ignelater luminosus]